MRPLMLQHTNLHARAKRPKRHHPLPGTHAPSIWPCVVAQSTINQLCGPHDPQVTWRHCPLNGSSGFNFALKKTASCRPSSPPVYTQAGPAAVSPSPRPAAPRPGVCGPAPRTCHISPPPGRHQRTPPATKRMQRSDHAHVIAGISKARLFACKDLPQGTCTHR